MSNHRILQCLTRRAGVAILILVAASPPALAEEAVPPSRAASAPAGSIDALFKPELTPAAAALLPEVVEPEQPDTAPILLAGFYQNDLARTYAAPAHWSKFRNTLDISGSGRFAGDFAWKLGGRFVYDPIYDLTNHYDPVVRNNQRLEASIREAYVDFSSHNLDFRIGRQHIVWGEMAGLFFADVVSAKDLRELALPEFDILRIPQWAARAEYFSDDFHAEAVWIPYMTYNDIGKPGAEFYPFTPPQIAGVSSTIADEDKSTGLNNSAYGLRISRIKSGWDISGFVYSTQDPEAAFARRILSPTSIAYQPIHGRILQLGTTLGKDLGALVLKVEAVYTQGKQSNVSRPSEADGLVKQNLLDYIVDLEWSFPQDTRFNLQFYQRWHPEPDPDLLVSGTESGLSILLSTKALHPKLESKLLLIHSLDRSDWITQLKLTWSIDGHWRAAFGTDAFGGTGAFGQFDQKDRVYTELRYAF